MRGRRRLEAARWRPTPPRPRPIRVRGARARRAPSCKDRWLRTLAEMENLRRRTEREVADARTYGVAGFARDMLAVADNMHRALAARPAPSCATTATPAVKALIEGVELTERELLEGAGEARRAQARAAKGEKFDPNFHQAMFEIPDRRGAVRHGRAGGAGRLHDRRAGAASGAGRRRQGRTEGPAGAANDDADAGSHRPKRARRGCFLRLTSMAEAGAIPCGGRRCHGISASGARKLTGPSSPNAAGPVFDGPWPDRARECRSRERRWRPMQCEEGAMSLQQVSGGSRGWGFATHRQMGGRHRSAAGAGDHCSRRRRSSRWSRAKPAWCCASARS